MFQQFFDNGFLVKCVYKFGVLFIDCVVVVVYCMQVLIMFKEVVVCLECGVVQYLIVYFFVVDKGMVVVYVVYCFFEEVKGSGVFFLFEVVVVLCIIGGEDRGFIRYIVEGFGQCQVLVE